MKNNKNEFYQGTIFEQGKAGQVTAFEVCDEADDEADEICKNCRGGSMNTCLLHCKNYSLFMPKEGVFL